jgi:RNA polymerase sigma-70 factor, ECF subfamily
MTAGSWTLPAIRSSSAAPPTWTRPDAPTFAALYETHVERIYRHIAARVGNDALAEDLTAQTFLRAWQSIDSYRPIADRPFVAWLFTISNNLVIDHFRRRRREVIGIVQEPPAGPGDDPERSAIAADLGGEIRRALSQLKPEHQLVVTLRLVDGAGYAEISAITGKSAGALRVIFCRAIGALRAELTRRGVTPDVVEVEPTASHSPYVDSVDGSAPAA